MRTGFKRKAIYDELSEIDHTDRILVIGPLKINLGRIRTNRSGMAWLKEQDKQELKELQMKAKHLGIE